MNLPHWQTEAAIFDRDDPLAAHRDRFHIPKHEGREVAYFCGNSLGLMPKQVREDVERELNAWQTLGVEGHFKSDRPWVSFHELFTMHLARIVGAKPSEVVAMNTLTVNLHLMLASFYRLEPKRFKVLVGHSAFPSDRYALSSQIALRGYQPKQAIVTVAPRRNEATLRTEDILAQIEANSSELSLVLMDGVNYYTGEFLDIPTIMAAAQKHGITVGFDLAHAVGNVPLSLHDWGVDFAVWCSYKYLNGGPGCPAGCFVHERHAENVPRFAGWWGHDKATRFQMGPDYKAIPGAEGWQLSNPPLFSLAALQASCEIFSEVGMTKLREKSVALTAFFEKGLRELFAKEIDIITPRDAARRGCQLSIREKQNARGTFERLQRSGVICDWREPDVIRLAPVPLYNRYSDIVRCLEVLGEKS